MLDFVAIGRRQVRAHAAVMPRNYHTAAAGGLGFIVAVDDLEAHVLGSRLERLGVLVAADAADVDDRLGREDVL